MRISASRPHQYSIFFKVLHFCQSGGCILFSHCDLIYLLLTFNGIKHDTCLLAVWTTLFLKSSLAHLPVLHCLFLLISMSFKYSEYSLLLSYTCYKHPLPVYGLPFHPSYDGFRWTEFLILSNQMYCSFPLWTVVFMFCLRPFTNFPTFSFL